MSAENQPTPPVSEKPAAASSLPGQEGEKWIAVKTQRHFRGIPERVISPINVLFIGELEQVSKLLDAHNMSLLAAATGQEEGEWKVEAVSSRRPDDKRLMNEIWVRSQCFPSGKRGGDKEERKVMHLASDNLLQSAENGTAEIASAQSTDEQFQADGFTDSAMPSRCVVEETFTVVADYWSRGQSHQVAPSQKVQPLRASAERLAAGKEAQTEK